MILMLSTVNRSMKVNNDMVIRLMIPARVSAL